MEVVKLLGALVVSQALVACGGLVPSDLFTLPDGGSVGLGEASTIAKDAAGQTSSKDAGADVGASPIDDATSPPPSDDATTVDDAGESEDGGGDDSGDDAGSGIPCGVFTCSGSTPVCCITVQMQGGQGNASTSCQGSSIDCGQNGGLSVSCASSDDCSSGEECCAEYGSNHMLQSVSCESSCGTGGLEVCQPNGPPGQCPNGDVCGMTQIDGYGVCYSQH